MNIETKKWEILCSEEQISAKLKELGEQISKDYEGKNLLVVSLLKGSFIFCADLVRNITVPVKIEFMTTSSYLSLSNVSIGYSFPKKWMEKAKLNTLRLSVAADNLFCLSARKGFIPMASMFGTSDVSQYTPLSSIIGTIKLSF